jgi:hypothetical protein
MGEVEALGRVRSSLRWERRAIVEWQAWAGIGAAAGAVVLFFAALVALGQLREIKRTRRAQLPLPVFQELRARDCHQALSYIYRNVDRSNPIVDGYTRRQIGLIVDRLELVGILVAKGMIEEDFAMKVTRSSALRFWYVIGKYLKQLPKERGHYAIFVEDYVRRCLQYELRNVRPDLRAKLEVPLPIQRQASRGTERILR